jgi:hypothetical protein
VASLIAVFVFWTKGFFVYSPAVNLQILSDGFFVSGILMTLFAGMLFVSREGALLGIGFVIRNVIQAFVPMGRRNHELYGEYRERKLNEMKKSSDHCVLLTGLIFLAVGIILTAVWYANYYSGPLK